MGEPLRFKEAYKESGDEVPLEWKKYEDPYLNYPYLNYTEIVDSGSRLRAHSCARTRSTR